MTAPGPDEKVCPYCAEVIKAAAIKCRYCQSDLDTPELTGAVAPAPIGLEKTAPVVPVVVPEETTEAQAPVQAPVPAPARPRDPVVRGLALLCAGLVVILLAGVAFTYLTKKPDDLRTAGNGQVTAKSFRSAAMSAASADAEAILSYSYKTLQDDQDAARDLLTSKFAGEYDSVMADAGKKATSAKLTQKASVLSAALLSITESKAEVLLYVNTVTTSEGSTRQQLLQNRVKMTLERKDGDWAVSDMVRF